MLSKNNKKILIAEDEPNIIDLLKIILSEKYEIAIAINGKETLELVDKFKPDLILLDIMMPIINGYDICEKIKKDPKKKNIIIAILSAKGQEKEIIKGLQLGADIYITKPFDPIELEKKIEELLIKK
jgi:two-component system, OmpR family, alkaline phosphatase synthesis response regulator PhoP